jgi:hypothetical protein
MSPANYTEGIYITCTFLPQEKKVQAMSLRVLALFVVGVVSE